MNFGTFSLLTVPLTIAILLFLFWNINLQKCVCHLISLRRMVAGCHWICEREGGVKMRLG